MNAISVERNILPLGEFKAHASQILRQLKGDQRPVVITQHGKPAGVLISPQDFDRLTERERFIAAIAEGLADADAGRVVSDDDLSAELDRLYGPVEP